MNINQYVNNRIHSDRPGNSNINLNNQNNPNNSDRNFMEKIIIRNKDPIQEKISDNYCITKCSNITTIKFEGTVFSYLTTPKTTEDFFFIPLSQKDFKFEIMDIEEYKEKYFDNTNIPFNRLKNFIEEMNFYLEDLHKEIMQKKRKIIFFNFLKIFFFLVFLSFFGFLILFSGENYFKFTIENTWKIFYFYSAISLLIFIYYIYTFFHDLNIEYEIGKIMLDRQEDLENVIYNWNFQYFSTNLNMESMIPIMFPYILINLQPSKRLFLENHEIYD